MKVAICTPCYGDTKALFTASLMGLVLGYPQARVNGVEVRPTFSFHMEIGNADIGGARQKVAERALATEPDYLLWVDSDQTFPAETLLRLMAHNLPFVGCNYARRGPPHQSTAFTCGKAIAPKSSGLEVVSALGFGVCLIEARVFHVLPRPWFAMSSAMGEDAFFCQQAAAHGFLPHVDHALSLEVGHVAEQVLRLSV